MKKILSLVIVFVLMTNLAFAERPMLISSNEEDGKVQFTVEQTGDEFIIKLSENPSTGYIWIYQIEDMDHVTYVSDDYISESNLLGAPGIRSYTFEVNSLGISTIEFKQARANDVIETLDILVYKTEEKLFVEENKIVTILDEEIDSQVKVVVLGEELLLDVMPEMIDGILMVPLAETLRTLGYEVTWQEESQSINIFKGAQWTSITIGNNGYFKNKMAQAPLSAAPILKNGRTLVPAEFFNAILDLGLEVEAGNIKITEEEITRYVGHVSAIDYGENGKTSYHIGLGDGSEVIVHTSSEYSYIQKEVEVGSLIKVIASPVTTMSMPAQTTGYLIY